MAADTLNLEAMEERELLALLGRIYGELLERLEVHLDVGEGDPDGDKYGDPAPPVPQALEAGVFLADRIQTLTFAFTHGCCGRDGVIPSRNGDVWLVGLDRFRRDFSRQSVRSEALNA